MTNEIIVEIRGGVLQQVYSTVPGLKIKAIDWDSDDLEDVKLNIELEEQTKSMFAIY